MIESIIATNLRRIRKHKRRTQADVAKQARISTQAYRNLEGGKSEPMVATLRKIADALDVGIEKLLEEVKPLSHVRFRANKKMISRDQILVDVTTWLNNFNMLEGLLDDRRPFKLDALQNKLKSYRGKDKPEYAAKEARKILFGSQNDFDEPIRNLAGLLEDGGIKVYPYTLASDTFFGLSVGKTDGGPAIIVNTWERITVERWIFSMAHELGHLLMHLGSYESDLEETEDEQQEREADRFGGEFLMPQASFKKEWNRTKGLHFYDRIMKVKRMFRVSYATVIHRLTRDLPGEKKNKAWMLFKMEHARRTGKSLTKSMEPEPMGQNDFPFVASTEFNKLIPADAMEDRLNHLVRQAVEQAKITAGRGAEILGLNMAEMRDLMKSWEYDFDVQG